VEKDWLSTNLQNAFRELLDDPQPAVRKALLAHFLAHPTASSHFLKTIATGNNRPLAWHARWFLEELRFSDPVAEFTGFIRSLNYELETGALLLNRTVFPRIDIGACCDTLDAIAARCRELFTEPMSLREKCRVINRVLFHEYGFHGNHEHYNDPLNSFLEQVLTRRTGIPLTLCLVYLLVAHRLGLELEPVGLPGYFVIGCYTEDRPFFIDAFEHGTFRTSEELIARLRAHNFTPKLADLAPVPVREVLCRCCRNLVNHYKAASDTEHAHLFTRFVEEFEATYERHAQP